MPDREKVIKELESLRDICNAKSNMAIGKGKVAWAGYANTADDAIALLKEQAAVEPILKRKGKSKMYNDYVCPVCDTDVFYEQCYCLECGKPFLWEGR